VLSLSENQLKQIGCMHDEATLHDTTIKNTQKNTEGVLNRANEKYIFAAFAYAPYCIGQRQR
jgi:hypothetical protein